jgi:hypothetical protein
MSRLTFVEKNNLEHLFDMGSGYVLDFSNRTFREFFIDACHIDIDDDKYSTNGTSKANRLRTFWEIETDHTVGKALHQLLKYCASQKSFDVEDENRYQNCQEAVTRLKNAPIPLTHVQQMAFVLDSEHIHQHIKRMQNAIESDPDQAIGSAKEFVESIAKTILIERNALPNSTKLDVRDLVKTCQKELSLVPQGIPSESKGADAVKLLLSNLGTVVDRLDELRGLYGTGHGKPSTYRGLTARHAKLAVGAATTLGVFLFETHLEKPVIATIAKPLKLAELLAT